LKAAAAKHPGLEREATYGAYEVWRVKENDGRYAVPLAVEPVLVVTPRWKEVAYRWFKRARPEDPVPVFVEALDEEAKRAFPTVYTELPREIPAKPLGPVPALEERMETPERLVVTGCRPGHPILIRISYHPRWKALSGERVWLAAPSFMLVVPRGERVELAWGTGPPVTLGALFTWTGLALLALAALPVGRRLAALLRPLLDVPPLPAAARLVAWTGSWSPRVRGAVLAAVFALGAALFGAAAVAGRATDADGLYRRAQRVYDTGRLRDALPLFRQARQLAPLSNTAIHSTYFASIVLLRVEEWAEAEQSFQSLVDTFPEAQAAAESLYHVGICRQRLGRVDAAVAAWEETRRRWPDSPWAKHAEARLAEVGKGPAG
jgi:hypothetical protein